MQDDEDRINSLIEMKASALSILERLNSFDPGDAQAAMTEYIALVDRFYEANEHNMAWKQCEKAKVDIKYFLTLAGAGDRVLSGYRSWRCKLTTRRGYILQEEIGC